MQRLFHYVGLSAASHELFKNKKLYQAISKKGQKTAEFYDIKNYTKKLLEIYNENISEMN